jgi:hypothetical protein
MRATRAVPAYLARRVPVQQALDLDTVREGEIAVYRLVLPFLPPSKNQINGWPPEWQRGAKKKWMRAITLRCGELGVPLGNPQVGLAAMLVFATKARRDPQNYAQQLWHWVPDALQGHTARCDARCALHAGVVVDDNEGRIEIGRNWGITMVVDDRKAPKSVIEKTVLTIAVRQAVPASRG